MRQLKLNIVTSGNIDVIGDTTQREVEKSENLAVLLTRIFPEKKGYWGKKPWYKLHISFLPDIPFGPDPEVLESFLFDSLEDDLELLINHFKLKGISLYGINNSGKKVIPNITYSKKTNRTELNLTAFEAGKLIEVLKYNKYTERDLISVFINQEQIFSYSLSAKTDFASLFTSADQLKDQKIEDFIDVINGNPLTGDLLVTDSHIHFISFKNWRFESDSNFLFTYPDFNRSIKMVQLDKKNEEPCINCLVCSSICPADLYPAQLYHHLIEENLAEAIAMGLDLCMSCRRCSVVCPSNIPLSAKIIDSKSSGSGDSL